VLVFLWSCSECFSITYQLFLQLSLALHVLPYPLLSNEDFFSLVPVPNFFRLT